MFGDFTWGTDVLPVLSDFVNNGLVRGAMIAMVAISVGVLAARGIISVFFKRE